MRWREETWSFLREGYRFLPRRFREQGRDLVDTRLLLHRTVALHGRDAARWFYEHDRLVRAGAAPGRITRTLTGQGGVQGLDGDAHRHRRAMLQQVLSSQREEALAHIAAAEWTRAAARWERAGSVVLLDEASCVLHRAVSAWAGVPVEEHATAQRTQEIRALIESPAAAGPTHLRGRLARRRVERRYAALVRATRDGEIQPPTETALSIISMHRDHEGQLLEDRVAAVELLNIIRPTVAVARYIVFMALALTAFPRSRRELLDGTIEPEWFVQEVRRLFPFFPAAVARASEDTEWAGESIPAGARVLLDLYGTNHDARLWTTPGRFDPARFANVVQDHYSLIPQGGGDPETSHRCAGEPATVSLMRDALRFLTEEIEYDVPPQDLRVSLRRIPTHPNSGFVISNIRPAPNVARTDDGE